MNKPMAKIAVSFQHGKGLVYDVDDYFRLRTEFRIVGNLVGVPVSHPRNINQHGLPALLSSHELKFLLDRSAIELIDKNAALLDAPCKDRHQLYTSMVERQKAEIQQPVIEKRIAEFRKHLPKIIEGKRKKLLKTGVNSEDITINAEELVCQEIEKLKQEKMDVMIQIPTKDVFSTQSSSPPFLLTPDESLKHRIFETLWSQGGYITVGDAFGCDFLLYPGDPMCFHASHMVHVLRNTQLMLDLKYLIRICRLSVVVNKLCVIAYMNETTNDVQFETIEWENSGNKSEIV